MAHSFTDSVNKFVAAADWLTDEDIPAIFTLEQIAMHLDLHPTTLHAPLVQQFGLAYRSLLKRKPGGTVAHDPLEDALKERGV